MPSMLQRVWETFLRITTVNERKHHDMVSQPVLQL